MPPFGPLLTGYLTAAGLSQRAFAKAARTPLSTINAVIAGRRKPPKRRLATWARILGLRSRAFDEFLVAGFLCHAPPEVSAALERLRAPADGEHRRAAEDGADYRP